MGSGYYNRFVGNGGVSGECITRSDCFELRVR